MLVLPPAKRHKPSPGITTPKPTPKPRSTPAPSSSKPKPSSSNTAAAAVQVEDIALERARSEFRLRLAWEDIIRRYSDTSLTSDEVSLETGEIVVDNGHLNALGEREEDVWRPEGKGDGEVRVFEEEVERVGKGKSKGKGKGKEKVEMEMEVRGIIRMCEECEMLDELEGVECTHLGNGEDNSSKGEVLDVKSSTSAKSVATTKTPQKTPRAKTSPPAIRHPETVSKSTTRPEDIWNDGPAFPKDPLWHDDPLANEPVPFRREELSSAKELLAGFIAPTLDEDGDQPEEEEEEDEAGEDEEQEEDGEEDDPRIFSSPVVLITRKPSFNRGDYTYIPSSPLKPVARTTSPKLPAATATSIARSSPPQPKSLPPFAVPSSPFPMVTPTPKAESPTEPALLTTSTKPSTSLTVAPPRPFHPEDPEPEPISAISTTTSHSYRTATSNSVSTSTSTEEATASSIDIPFLSPLSIRTRPLLRSDEIAESEHGGSPRKASPIPPSSPGFLLQRQVTETPTARRYRGADYYSRNSDSQSRNQDQDDALPATSAEPMTPLQTSPALKHTYSKRPSWQQSSQPSSPLHGHRKEREAWFRMRSPELAYSSSTPPRTGGMRERSPEIGEERDEKRGSDDGEREDVGMETPPESSEVDVDEMELSVAKEGNSVSEEDDEVIPKSSPPKSQKSQRQQKIQYTPRLPSPKPTTTPFRKPLLPATASFSVPASKRHQTPASKLRREGSTAPRSAPRLSRRKDKEKEKRRWSLFEIASDDVVPSDDNRDDEVLFKRKGKRNLDDMLADEDGDVVVTGGRWGSSNNNVGDTMSRVKREESILRTGRCGDEGYSCGRRFCFVCL